MFERALAHPAFAAATQTARARALLGTGTLAVFRGDADLALRMLEQAHAAALAVGDLSTAAIALRWTAYAHTVHGDRVAAARVANAAVELAIAAGDPHADAQASSLTTVDGPLRRPSG